MVISRPYGSSIFLCWVEIRNPAVVCSLVFAILFSYSTATFTKGDYNWIVSRPIASLCAISMARGLEWDGTDYYVGSYYSNSACISYLLRNILHNICKEVIVLFSNFFYFSV